jgi:hypothetical protein
MDGCQSAGGCDAKSCPEGCCDLELGCVTRSATACAAVGETCASCADMLGANKADSCSAAGDCICAAAGVACVADQTCTANGCQRCTAANCTGCCGQDDECHMTDLNHCGLNGAACEDCGSIGDRADLCSDQGKCVCAAAGHACTAPETCSATGCIVCDATTCASGCCGPKNVCITPDVANCGAGGSMCLSCDAQYPGRADSCSTAGQCVCAATGSLCGANEYCTAQGCISQDCTCPQGQCYTLPVTYEKTCTSSSPQTCTQLTQASDSYYSGTLGATSFAVFDVSVLPANATIHDAVFMLYPKTGNVCGGELSATDRSIDGSLDTLGNPMSPYSWSMYCGGSQPITEQFGLSACTFNRCAWLRSSDQSVPDTLAKLVQDWRSGAVPNNGLTFQPNGIAASSHSNPGLVLKVCAQ